MAYQYAPPNWKLRARIWIIVVFLTLCAADYLLLTFTYNEFNPIPLMSGVAIMSALCSKALLIGMWRRLAWARYTLIGLLFASLMAFAILMFKMVGSKAPRPSGLLKKPIAAMALQMMALVPLGKSRSIRRQMHPMTGRN